MLISFHRKNQTLSKEEKISHDKFDSINHYEMGSINNDEFDTANQNKFDSTNHDKFDSLYLSPDFYIFPSSRSGVLRTEKVRGLSC